MGHKKRTPNVIAKTKKMKRSKKYVNTQRSNFQKSKISVQGSIKKEGFLAHEKTKTQKKARNNIIKTKKNLRKHQQFWTTTRTNKRTTNNSFSKKNKNKKPSKQICRKKHRFFRLPILVVKN